MEETEAEVKDMGEVVVVVVVVNTRLGRRNKGREEKNIINSISLIK